MPIPILPHEVKTLKCVEAPRISVNTCVIYDGENMYSVMVEDENGDWYTVGSFPSDVAHIMLDPIGEFEEF